MSLIVTRLNIYPIKSCAGMSVPSFQIGEEGPELVYPSGKVADRGWMFVNSAGEFQTQRNLPQMALLRPEMDAGKFYLKVEGRNYEIPMTLDNPVRKEVQVWGKQLNAAVVTGDASKAASDLLKFDVQLVQFDAKCYRETMLKGEGMGVGTRFTDSQPYLVASEESLSDLNTKLQIPIGHERFRANIWIQGAKYPYREDQYLRLEHSSFQLEATKGCARCKVITVDESKGEIHSQEPLKVLAQYRRRETQVYFGQYFLAKEFGATLQMGEELTGQLS
jgi:uncharacterized protein